MRAFDRKIGKNRSLSLASMFGAFVFMQFTVLGLANHAGEGCLTTAQRDMVYYSLQIFVIAGYVLYSLFYRFMQGKRAGKPAAVSVFGLFPVCCILLSLTRQDSVFYVAVSMAAALCLGALGGAAHLRMSMAAFSGAGAARCMGLGSSAAIVLQYLLQIRWGVTPFLPVFMLAAYVLFLFILERNVPEAVMDGERRKTHTPPRRIVFCIVIAAVFILFTCFYNETIHHLMIRSDYASANVYSWPRLMLVPGYLLFALIGDKRNGKYVPVTSLCIMLVTLLTVILIRSSEAYRLNMCLFYFSIAAFTSYYLLTFWRLAPGTKHPAFWAPFGRMLDSAMVLLTGAVNLSALPAPVVLGVDIAGVAVVILLMAVGGDLNLTEMPFAPETASDGAETPAALSPEEALSRMEERYQLTPREAEVLQKLLMTEDELQTIADSMYISRRVLGRHITAIYQKTGAKSRVGLYQIYHAISRET